MMQGLLAFVGVVCFMVGIVVGQQITIWSWQRKMPERPWENAR